jgi:4-diphosphocytidyl-2-C-methyl-D-erythritol kinase
MITFPNAKINLGLSITTRRSDGFHTVETVLIPIPFRDILEIVPTDQETTISYSGLPIPGDPARNLVLQAIDQIRTAYSIPNVRLHLHKNIPMGAGLGGGSSDAAFALKTLNDLFSLDIPENVLKDYAGKLGSDCPFFIENQPSLAQGKGDRTTPMPVNLEGLNLILVFPGIHIETKKAYSWIKPSVKTHPLKEIVSMDIKEWKKFLVNDFESVVFDRYPALSRIKQTLYEKGALYAALSGSGSALFGLFDSGKKLPDKDDFPACTFWRGKL